MALRHDKSEPRSLARAVLAAALLIAVALTFTRSAHAQTPASTPVPPTVAPSPNVFPYKIVISGPRTAVTGTTIAYTLDYRWVAAPTASEAAGIVLGSEFGTLVSVTPVSGEAPTDAGPQARYYENYELNGEAGTLRVVVQPPPGFTGLFGLGFYVRGTEIYYPDGTVDGSTTLVAVPGSMIIMGQVPAPVGEHVSVEALNASPAQPVTCDSMTSRPWEVPGPLFASPVYVPGATPTEVPNPSYFGFIVAPSCVGSPPTSLRICWSADLPPSPPPAVDTRPCYTALTFSEGVRAVGLLSATAKESTPNAGGPSTGTSRVTGPNTGDGASAGHRGARVARALAIAALCTLMLGGTVLLRQRR
jgi:hypothetical protein